MIDFKKSILNLHTKFPEKDLDELLEILDCIVDTPECFFPSTEIGVRRMPYVTEPKSVQLSKNLCIIRLILLNNKI